MAGCVKVCAWLVRTNDIRYNLQLKSSGVLIKVLQQEVLWHIPSVGDSHSGREEEAGSVPTTYITAVRTKYNTSASMTLFSHMMFVARKSRLMKQAKKMKVRNQCLRYKLLRDKSDLNKFSEAQNNDVRTIIRDATMMAWEVTGATNGDNKDSFKKCEQIERMDSNASTLTVIPDNGSNGIIESTAIIERKKTLIDSDDYKLERMVAFVFDQKFHPANQLQGLKRSRTVQRLSKNPKKKCHRLDKSIDVKYLEASRAESDERTRESITLSCGIRMDK
ncbi:uncharacterized protein [Venturia canescens]|uniref:uncharacterized protein isoform X1 n=1 Tax=Venturia canescens TaxID=32260 RepID=UPI001C9CA984|nr:uncharacterized protein LOC122417048 isoform X1 [Venturia canescens]